MRQLLVRLAGVFSPRRIWGPALTILGLVVQAAHSLGLDVSRHFWPVGRSLAHRRDNGRQSGDSCPHHFLLAVRFRSDRRWRWIHSLSRRAREGTQRHAWWPYVAASVFFICLAALTAGAVYGALELYIRKQIAEGVAGIPRGPEASDPNRPQTPFTKGNWGGITPDQMRVLVQELPKLPLTYLQFFRSRGTMPVGSIGTNSTMFFSEAVSRGYFLWVFSKQPHKDDRRLKAARS
jgi:hypothetical protein